MTDEEVPEKLYMLRADIGMKSAMFMLTSDKFENSNIEYILKSVADKRVDDAIKPIREVYEKYKGSDFYNVSEEDLRDILWQAIKATVKGEEIET